MPATPRVSVCQIFRSLAKEFRVGRGQNRVRLSPCDNSPVLEHKSVIHENGKKGITIRVFPADQINLPDTQFEPPPLHLINISKPNGAYSGPNARISSVKSRIGLKILTFIGSGLLPSVNHFQFQRKQYWNKPNLLHNQLLTLTPENNDI